MPDIVGRSGCEGVRKQGKRDNESDPDINELLSLPRVSFGL
jgi:hypothetical protein